MSQTTHQIKSNQVISDDLAFSAFLRIKGYQLIKLDQKKSKSSFTFELGKEDAGQLKMNFVNSEFLNYYNELRNLKKQI